MATFLLPIVNSQRWNLRSKNRCTPGIREIKHHGFWLMKFVKTYEIRTSEPVYNFLWSIIHFWLVKNRIDHPSEGEVSIKMPCPFQLFVIQLFICPAILTKRASIMQLQLFVCFIQRLVLLDTEHWIGAFPYAQRQLNGTKCYRSSAQ